MCNLITDGDFPVPIKWSHEELVVVVVMSGGYNDTHPPTPPPPGVILLKLRWGLNRCDVGAESFVSITVHSVFASTERHGNATASVKHAVDVSLFNWLRIKESCSLK